MKILRTADVSDYCSRGLSIVKAHIGAEDGMELTERVEKGAFGEQVFDVMTRRKGGAYKTIGVRLLIEVPTPFKKEFVVDYGRSKVVCMANAFVVVELFWFGFRSRIECGLCMSQSAAQEWRR